MRTRTAPFNCRLDTTARRMLQELANDAGVTMSQIVRDLIAHRYKMVKQGLPTCANGDGCIMAGMWIQNKGALLAVQQAQIPGSEPPPLPHALFKDVG